MQTKFLMSEPNHVFSDLTELRELSECEDEQQIKDLLEALTRKMGMEYFLYGARFLIDRNEKVERTLTNFPTAWRQKYDENQYVAFDPIVAHAYSKLTPIIWQPSTYQTKEQNRIFEEAQAFGLKSGITYPVHGPHGDMGMLSFALSCESLAADTLIRKNLFYGTMLASVVHEAMHRIVNKVGLALKAPLTKRELECLKWIASGKTSWEIATILSISQHGVIHHVRNLMTKFDVSSRHQAVARASICGLI